MSTELVTITPPQDLMRNATDIAQVCRDIVTACAVEIQGHKYVRVEGWMAIAVAHNCIASARDVKRVEDGYMAIGEVKRMTDGVVLCQGEGFVGEDEATWFGGKALVWDKQAREKREKILPKRDDYAIRAMAQTRAISRACRSGFAHVVVMMNAGLSTTPAEEVPDGGFDNGHDEPRGSIDPTGQGDSFREPQAKSGNGFDASSVKGEQKFGPLEVVDVTEKTGKSTKGDWKAFFVKFSNGMEAGTFSATTGQAAIQMLHDGSKCTAMVKPSTAKPGRLELVDICDELP
jgi:hypothetical protein